MTMLTRRVLLSMVSGVALSALAFIVGKSGGNGWRLIPELPGFVVAMFTPGFGVHGDVWAFYALMLIANAIFYGLAVYACYPLFTRKRKQD